MSIEVDFVEVLKIVQQFLAENNLKKSLKALQEETNVVDNTIDDLEAFKTDVITGRWDRVLKVTLNLSLPDSKLADLYEQIAIEIIEMGEMSVARTFIRQTDPLNYLKERHLDRYLHLEHLLTLTHFDASEAYPPNVTKEKRRRALAQSLSREIRVSPPSRLLTLIGQAVRWQKSQDLVEDGSAYDIIKGSFTIPKADIDAPVVEPYAKIKFPKSQRAQCAKFSPGGKYFVTGTLDGFIEVWNYMTGKLRKDMPYQAMDNIMLMEASVNSLAFSEDCEYLASGDQNGRIKIWRMSTGGCILKLPTAHSQGVTSLCFTPNRSGVVSGSFDSSVRLHSLRSGKLIRNFVGHSSYVNGVLVTPCGKKVISVSSDGSTKIWSINTGQTLATLNFDNGSIATPGMPCKSITQVILDPVAPERYYIVDKSDYIYIISEGGKLLDSYKLTASRSSGGEETSNSLSQDNIVISLSPNGDLIYCAREDNYVYVFDSSTKAQIGHFMVSESTVITIVHHTSSNILATLSLDGYVRFWKS